MVEGTNKKDLDEQIFIAKMQVIHSIKSIIKDSVSFKFIDLGLDSLKDYILFCFYYDFFNKKDNVANKKIEEKILMNKIKVINAVKQILRVSSSFEELDKQINEFENMIKNFYKMESSNKNIVFYFESRK